MRRLRTFNAMYDDINKDINHTDFQGEKSVKWLFGNIITLKKNGCYGNHIYNEKGEKSQYYMECRGKPIMLL